MCFDNLYSFHYIQIIEKISIFVKVFFWQILMINLIAVPTTFW